MKYSIAALKPAGLLLSALLPQECNVNSLDKRTIKHNQTHYNIAGVRGVVMGATGLRGYLGTEGPWKPTL